MTCWRGEGAVLWKWQQQQYLCKCGTLSTALSCNCLSLSSQGKHCCHHIEVR